MLQLAFLCSHNNYSNSKRVENLSHLLRFFFFGLKFPIFRFCVCSGISLAQLWEAILQICSFFLRKRNFFFTFIQSLMRTSPTFYDYGKYAFGFEDFETERRKSEMMLLKSYATFSNQQLQLLKNVAKSKI